MNLIFGPHHVNYLVYFPVKDVVRFPALCLWNAVEDEVVSLLLLEVVHLFVHVRHSLQQKI